MSGLRDVIDDLRFDERIARLASADAKRKRAMLASVERRARRQRVTPRGRAVVVNENVWEALALSTGAERR